MSLVAHYKLDSTPHDSINGYTGTWSGSATYVAGKINNAASFSGGTNRIASDTSWFNTQFLNGSNLTWSAWIKRTAESGTYNMFMGNYLPYFSIGGASYSSRFCFSLKVNGIQQTLYSNTDYASNVWLHAVATYNGDRIRIYVNGVLDGTSSSIPGLITDIFGNFTIGDGRHDSQWYPFTGLVDDVRVYNHALSLKEVKELYKAKILHFRFDRLEEYTTNYLINPQDFSISPWVIYNTNSVVITSPIVGPDGTPAHLMVNNNQALSLLQQPIPLSTSGTGIQTATVYVKYHSATYFTFNCYYVGDTEVNKNFYPATGTCEAGATIESVGRSGWYRCTITVPAKVNGTYLFFRIWPGGRDLTNTLGCYFWHPQIESKDHATPYVNGTRADVITDSSGYGNVGVISQGGPKWQQTIRNIGVGAVYFRGVGYPDYIGVVLSGLWAGDTSVAWWEYDLDNTNKIAMSTGSYLSSGVYMHRGAPVYIRLSNDTDAAAGSTWTVTTNVWRHHAFTYNATSRVFTHYINGGSIGSETLATTIKPSIANTFIGTYNVDTANWAINGYLDDFRIYNSCLSQADVTELYQTRAQIDNQGALIV